ncbi:MAG TPA: branched-chain amino acid ABC transporter permease, partial [bacterium]|nr:branched-chain amino acid ABC transporter permease [bacterium]
MTNRRALLFTALSALVATAVSAVLPEYYAGIALAIGINALLAVSLNLVNGITGQFSLGHAGFMAVGAYCAAYLSSGPLAGLFASPVQGQLGVALCLLAAALVAGAAGWLVGLPSLRLRGDYLAIVTLGFGEIIRVALLNSDSLGGARGFIGVPAFPARAGAPWVFGLLALSMAACVRVMGSSHGRALLSIRED